MATMIIETWTGKAILFVILAVLVLLFWLDYKANRPDRRNKGEDDNG